MAPPLIVDRTLLTLKVLGLTAFWAPIGIITGTVSAVPKLLGAIVISLADFVVFFLPSMLTPQKPRGKVIPQGKPGFGGIWPPFVAPDLDNGDSRSPCPGLNVLSNHGILPRNGRGITMAMFEQSLQETYNVAPTLTKNVMTQLAGLYGRDRIDLGDLNSHNLVEHDASFIRHDAFFEPNQAPPAKDLIQKLLASASGPVTPEHPKGSLTPSDISNFFSLRIAQSKRDNPTFSLATSAKLFAVNNACLFYEVFGGDVQACSTFLAEEKFPDGWETNCRQRFGFSAYEFYMRSAEIFLGVKTVKL